MHTTLSKDGLAVSGDEIETDSSDESDTKSTTSTRTPSSRSGSETEQTDVLTETGEDAVGGRPKPSTSLELAQQLYLEQYGRNNEEK
ncbi:MAG: 9.3 kDa unknown protein [Plant associated tobamo-like virus 1]|nr:MAG: 9.3 kDa unknown protein [Plant associated tobamo-like virus 1]UTQ50509.1 MAG: 9.3 kDa unknown protein [Plant associated tobamo-like virus 1]UTQ50512.1 MAG: 9.3 kDa unknown protein [Plant associated tobamo-like virus 1]